MVVDDKSNKVTGLYINRVYSRFFFGRALFFEVGRFFLILGPFSRNFVFLGPLMGPTTRLDETLS